MSNWRSLCLGTTKKLFRAHYILNTDNTKLLEAILLDKRLANTILVQPLACMGTRHAESHVTCIHPINTHNQNDNNPFSKTPYLAQQQRTPGKQLNRIHQYTSPFSGNTGLANEHHTGTQLAYGENMK